MPTRWRQKSTGIDKGKKGSPYSITERRVPELIQVLGSQPAGNVSHKPGGRLPLLFATLKDRGTMGVNSLPKTVRDSVAAAI